MEYEAPAKQHGERSYRLRVCEPFDAQGDACLRKIEVQRTSSAVATAFLVITQTSEQASHAESSARSDVQGCGRTPINMSGALCLQLISF